MSLIDVLDFMVMFTITLFIITAVYCAMREHHQWNNHIPYWQYFQQNSFVYLVLKPFRGAWRVIVWWRERYL